MAFTVKVIGDIEYIAETMRAVSHIMSLSSFGGLIAIGFLLGIVWIITQGVLSGGKEIKAQNMIVAAIMYAAFFGIDSAEVLLESDRAGYSLAVPQYEVVQDVPLGLAITSSVISTAGSVVSDWYRTHFQTINPYGMDPLFTLELLMRMRDVGFDTTDLNWDPKGQIADNLDRYIDECTQVGMTIKRADGSVPISPEDILKAGSPGHPANAWAAMKFNNNFYYTMIRYEASPGGGGGGSPVMQTATLGCADAHDEITSKVMTADTANNWIKEMVVVTCANNSSSGLCPTNIGGNGAAIDTFLNNSVSQFNVARDAFLHTSVATDVALFNRAALGALVRAKKSGRLRTEGDIMVSLIADRASGKITQTQALQGAIWERSMLPLMTFFESIMYIAAPFAAFMLALGMGGITLIGKYLGFAIWIQLWKPVMAAIERFIEMAAMGSMSALQQYSGNLTGDLGTIARDTEAFTEISHWIGTGSMLMAATPAITLMLIYGSAVTASSLAGRVDASAGASVGTDDTKAKYDSGGRVSQANAAGYIADGTVATQDDSSGNISFQSMAASALQASTKRESSFRASAASQRSEAAKSGQEGLASYVEGLGNLSTIGTTTGTIAQQADSISQDLVASNALSQTERASTNAALQIGLSGRAGFDSAKKDASRILKQQGVETDGWSDAQWGKAIGIMATAGASGSIDYTEMQGRVEDMSKREQLAIQESWTKTTGLSEADQSNVTDSYSRNENIKSSRESSRTATQNRELAEAEANSRASIENLSLGGGLGTKFGMADVNAHLNDPEVQRNVSDHIQFMQDRGDAAYQGVPANVAGARQLINSSLASGDVTTLAGVMGAMGAKQLDPHAATAALVGDGENYVGGVEGVQPKQPSDSLNNFYDKATSGVMSTSNMNNQWLDTQAQRLKGKIPEKTYDASGVGSEKMLDTLIDRNGLDKDKDLGMDYDNLSTGAKANRLYSVLNEMNAPDNAARDAHDTVKYLASEEGREALIDTAGYTAAGGGAGLLSTVAMGSLRGAASGGFRGARAGAYGMAAGALVGAAYGGYKAYSEMEDKETEASILALTGGQLDSTRLSSLDGEQTDYLNESVKSVAFNQMEAMAEAAKNGEEFDESAFRSGLGTDFERAIFDNMGSLLGTNELDSARNDIGQAIDRGAKHQILVDAGLASNRTAGLQAPMEHTDHLLNRIGDKYDSFVDRNGEIQTADQESDFVGKLTQAEKYMYAHRAELGMAGLGTSIENDSFFEWRDNDWIQGLRTDEAIQNFGATPNDMPDMMQPMQPVYRSVGETQGTDAPGDVAARETGRESDASAVTGADFGRGGPISNKDFFNR